MPTQTSQLVSNLQTIYNTKLEIKSVLGTNSDDFTQYPELIQAAISEGGGGSGSGNPYDDAISVADMIMDGETTADYVCSIIMSDFGTNGTNSTWCETVTIDTGEVDQNDEPIMEEKKVLFVVPIDATDIAQTLEDYPDLYDFIYPIIQDATLSVATGDDAEDGYDYVLEGELYLWNLNDMCDPVVEITENGFYPSADSVSLGFNVNVESSGETVDPYYNSIASSEMIENEETTADYVRTAISDNFEWDEPEQGEYVISWDETAEVYTGEDDPNTGDSIYENKTIHVVITGNPYDIASTGQQLVTAFEDYSDLYNNIFPTLENATLTASEDPLEDGYDYLLEGDIYAWNMNDNSNQVQEITENGFYPNEGQAGFYVDIEGSGGGLEKGSFYIFNWLEMGGGNNAKIIMDNKPLSDLVLLNLEPINYIDPTTQEDTHNSFYGIEPYDSNKDTIITFDDMTSASRYGSGGNYIGFKNLDDESLSDTIDSVHATLQVWVSENDPQYVDGGYWESSDSYSASFSDSYTITSDDEVVINVHILQNNLVADLFINGILTEESVTLTVVV